MPVAAQQSVELTPAIHHLIQSVEHMRLDVQQINARINQLEHSLTEVKNNQLRKKVKTHININVLNYTNKRSMCQSKIMELKHPKWWPFTEISPTWFVFMIVWPFLAQRMMNRIQRQKWLSPTLPSTLSPSSSASSLHASADDDSRCLVIGHHHNRSMSHRSTDAIHDPYTRQCDTYRYYLCFVNWLFCVIASFTYFRNILFEISLILNFFYNCDCYYC